jgi:hypothetical protein
MIKSITWKARPGTKSWWISSLNAKSIVMRSTVKLLKRCVFPMPTGFEEFVVVDRIVEKNARATRNESTAYSKKCMSWPRSSAAEELLRLGRGTALRTPTGCFQQGCGEVAVGIGVAGKEENDGCPEYYRQPGFDDIFHLWILGG